jgi:DNA-binding XRE family transcriptional regulator
MQTALKTRRQELQLTQKEVADKLNLKRQTYNKYENGLRQPRISVMKQIAELFGKSMDDLFF